MRHGIHLSILSLALLTACGPEEVGDPGSDEGDEGWQLNTDSDTRQTCTTCPNGGKVTPKAPTTFTKSIDAYASYVGQSTCSGTSKPGVVAFKNLVLATYPCTSSGGIVRGCSVGGTSEHKEGRAWDWMVNAPSTAVDSMLGWLLATDSFGNKHAMARRLGIMYMIWNRKMWRAYRPNDGWQAYTGSNPHTDHVHFSFSWAGAKKTTSYWNAPAASTTPTPAPTPAPTTPAAQAPKGALETVNCSEIVGWAQDPDVPTGTVDVEVYIDQLPGAAGSSPLTAKANINRTDLCTTLGSCEHGFKIETPATYRDGLTHTVRAYALDAGARTLIGGPVGISCSSSIDPQAQDPQQPSPEASDGEVDPTPEATPEQVSLVGTCALAAAPRLSDGWWLLALVGLALLRRRDA
jgi:hypothetical protein